MDYDYPGQFGMWLRALFLFAFLSATTVLAMMRIFNGIEYSNSTLKPAMVPDGGWTKARDGTVYHLHSAVMGRLDKIHLFEKYLSYRNWAESGQAWRGSVWVSSCL